YEFYRRAGFRRELMVSEPGVQGILDFLSETIPEAKKAKPSQFFDDRLAKQVNDSKKRVVRRENPRTLFAGSKRLWKELFPLNKVKDLLRNNPNHGGRFHG